MRYLFLALTVLVAGCGKQEAQHRAADLKMYEVSEPPAAAPAPLLAQPAPQAEDGAGQASQPAPAAPQIAYVYSLGYRLSGERVAAVQQRHTGLCDRLGPAHCHIVTMSREAGENGAPAGALTLVVEARLARAFEERLDAAVSGAGGSVSSRGIEAEDLSKQMVDTAAKVRAKEVLTERLLALLAKRDGKVGELVEAERAYAQAQEDLDAARSWLAEMRGRVAMSKIDIRYEGIAPAANSAWSPVRDAFRSAGNVLGASAASLVRVLLAALPWLLALALLVWLLRRRGWRLRLPRLPWRRPATV